MNKLKQNILSLVGLFIPVKFEENVKWAFTMQIGLIPLGWIIVIIALIIKSL
jgi:hypothetical protein